MSTPVLPRDGDALLPLHALAPLSDEAALRHAFLAEYPTLAAEARADLGDHADALSPKVVEGAFVRAWDARTRLTSPAQLHDFLVEDVHHGAARALSRRMAAHRLGNHDVHSDAHVVAHALREADAEVSWGHIMHALHGEAHSPQALAAAADISRHEAAAHIAVATKEKSILAPIAIMAVALAVVIAGGMLLDRLGTDSRIASAVNASTARVHVSLPAQIGVVTLDDGSRVQLAPESKLSIPAAFGPKLRAVKLEGTATFDIAKGAQPFQVHARDAVLVARGTAFTVRAYPSDNAVSLVVREGVVEVRRGETRQDVPAGGSLRLAAGEATRAATEAERSEIDGWRSGVLSIANRPLREVLPALRRWYGLQIVVQKDALLDRPVTFRASLDSSRQAIRGVEQSTGLEFGYAGPNMVFRERSEVPKR